MGLPCMAVMYLNGPGEDAAWRNFCTKPKGHEPRNLHGNHEYTWSQSPENEDLIRDGIVARVGHAI